MFPRQFIASFILGVLLMALTIRLVQTKKLDIAYCWVWLGISVGALVVVLRYNWLEWITHVIGAIAPTTTLFMMGFFVILLMCMQFSLVVSQQRRQIRELSQRLALLSGESSIGSRDDASRVRPGERDTVEGDAPPSDPGGPPSA